MLVAVTLVLATGGVFAKVPARGWAPAAAGVWLTAWWAAPRVRAGPVAMWTALLLATAFRGAAHREWIDAQHARLGLDDRLVRARVRVAEHPSVSDAGATAAVAVLASDIRLPGGTLISLQFPPGPPPAQGEVLALLAWVRAPPPRRNPGGRSAADYLAAHGVGGIGRVVDARTLSPPSWAWPAR